MTTDTLTALFGSKTRVRVLRLFLLNPDTQFTTAEIVARTQMSSVDVQREMRMLERITFVKVRRVKGKKHYRANKDFPLRDHGHSPYGRVGLGFEPMRAKSVSKTRRARKEERAFTTLGFKSRGSNALGRETPLSYQGQPSTTFTGERPAKMAFCTSNPPSDVFRMLVHRLGKKAGPDEVFCRTARCEGRRCGGRQCRQSCHFQVRGVSERVVVLASSTLG